MPLNLKTTPSKILLGISFLMIAGSVMAGSLEPPAGPPAPTMKTLDEIPPSWHQILPAAQRFQFVLGNTSVLDKETGLVWEKQPQVSAMKWSDALNYCYQPLLNKPRGGWRLPTIEELSSLFDTSQLPAVIPPGFFVGVSGVYWTSTTDPRNSSNAYTIDSGSGSVFPQAKTPITPVAVPWCVRGGAGHSS